MRLNQQRMNFSLLAPSDRMLELDAVNDAGETPLHCAAKHDRTEMVRLLAEAGANVNLPDNTGATPLHSAVAGGFADAARLLLSYGADPQTEDGAGRKVVDYEAWSALGLTPVATTDLHRAVERNDLAEAKRLLDEGVPVDCWVGGLTALHRAVILCQEEMTGLLVDRGADILARTKCSVARSILTGQIFA